MSRSCSASLAGASALASAFPLTATADLDFFDFDFDLDLLGIACACAVERARVSRVEKKTVAKGVFFCTPRLLELKNVLYSGLDGRLALVGEGEEPTQLVARSRRVQHGGEGDGDEVHERRLSLSRDEIHRDGDEKTY